VYYGGRPGQWAGGVHSDVRSLKFKQFLSNFHENWGNMFMGIISRPSLIISQIVSATSELYMAFIYTNKGKFTFSRFFLK
jgi:hypothetical protein